MNKDQKRIAIAEAHGFKNIKFSRAAGFQYGLEGEWDFEKGPAPRNYSGHIPDYFNDLNAIHKAWLTLNLEKRQRFVVELGKIASNGQAGYWPTSEMVGATAEQRAEAFGLTLGLWS